MKRTIFLSVVLITSSILIWSCSDYVQTVQPRGDVIAEDALTNADQVGFLVAGLQQRMTQTYSQITTYAGLLSDELYYDTRLPGATFPQFDEIEKGLITLDNNSVSGIWGTNTFTNTTGGMGSLRFHADNLIDRLSKIQFPTSSASQKQSAAYQAYMHAGAIRYFYAAYFGLEARRPGGILSKGEVAGPFVPETAMIDSALNMLNLALQNASTDLQRRTINTLIAKTNLLNRRYDAARTAAQNGLRRGDAAWNVLYSTATVPNAWYGDAGRGRVQMAPDGRFIDYVRADSLEGRIIPGTISSLGFTVNGYAQSPEDPDQATLAASRRLILVGASAGNPYNLGGLRYVFQLRYPNQNTPHPITNWQENELILAETAVRAGNDAAALTSVNTVRTFYGLTARTTTNLDSVIIERDKTLFGMGVRLTDQRRFALENRSIARSASTYVADAQRNSAWHLTNDTWWVLPIPNTERAANPNLKTN